MPARDPLCSFYDYLRWAGITRREGAKKKTNSPRFSSPRVVSVKLDDRRAHFRESLRQEFRRIFATMIIFRERLSLGRPGASSVFHAGNLRGNSIFRRISVCRAFLRGRFSRGRREGRRRRSKGRGGLYRRERRVNVRETDKRAKVGRQRRERERERARSCCRGSSQPPSGPFWSFARDAGN